MRRRVLTLAGLVAVILALAAVYTLVLRPANAPESDTSAKPVYLINEEKPNLAGITIARRGENAYTLLNNVYYDADLRAIESDEPIYLIDGMPDFAVNVARGLDIVNYTLSLRAQSAVIGATDDLAAFGLTEPALTVTARLRDGRETTVLFGDSAPSGAYVYIKRADEDDVYIAFQAVFDALDMPLEMLEEGAVLVDAHQ